MGKYMKVAESILTMAFGISLGIYGASWISKKFPV